MSSSDYSLLYLKAVIIALLLLVAVHDIYKRRIPNSVLLLLTIICFVTFPFSWTYLLVSGSILLFGLVAFRYRLLGAGDSKLLAICAYSVAEQWHVLLLNTALYGGILSCVYLAYNQFVRKGWIVAEQQASVPYGVAISIAAITSIQLM